MSLPSPSSDVPISASFGSDLKLLPFSSGGGGGDFGRKTSLPYSLLKNGSVKWRIDEMGFFGIDLTVLASGSAILVFIGFRLVNLEVAGDGGSMASELQTIFVAASWISMIVSCERLLTGFEFSIFSLQIPVGDGRSWMGFYLTGGDCSSASSGGGVVGLHVVFCFCCIYVGTGWWRCSPGLLVSTFSVDWCMVCLSFMGIRNRTDCIHFFILPSQILHSETELGLLGVFSKLLFLCFVSVVVVVVVSSGRLVEVRCLSGVVPAIVRL